MHFTIIAVLTAVASLGGFLVLLFFRPFALAHLIAEDNFGEFGTAVCHLIAATILLVMATRPLPKSTKAVAVVLASAALFIAGEEISWGTRIIDYPVPKIFSEINTQQELTVHNIEFVRRVADPIEVLSKIIIVWAIISFSIQALARRRFHSLVERGMPFIPASLLPLFAFVPLFTFHPILAKWELAELSFAVAVMFWTYWFAARHIVRSDLNSGRAVLLAAVILWFAPLLLTVQLTNVFGSKWSLKWELTDLPNNDFLRNLPDQRKAVYRYVLSNPSYRTFEARVDYADLLIELDEHCAARQQLETVAGQIRKLHRGRQPRPETLRVLGSIYFRLNEPQRAEAAFQSAIAIDRRRVEASVDDNALTPLLESLSTTMTQMGRLEESLQLAEQARRLATTAEQRWTLDRRLRSLKRRIRRLERKGLNEPRLPAVEAFAAECAGRSNDAVYSLPGAG